ncbi:PocR ligand-binding domain-containing protein [Desulfoscipio gibsoniae]|uniref:Response regulator containing CheY-like receiver domain and AraC-type DNA-binding domain n=1 Tax=Desulfoscipio gibsoniae DSM 7213 TaxID=767817 RepID=R4KSA9_9FIRM|nr:PocR ligand-binding domain-containing protein [Desulfoscipio gibsoniae]AGL02481.1 response regulator containing CheY-like receiver domain and AraC-type DNA-binding domain [Desulfoscipio gibsoniae DSM 7213]
MNERLVSFTQKIIQPVLDNISKREKIWLKFIDHSGKYIATTHSRSQCSFCRYIRSSYSGNKRCRGSARQVVFACQGNNQPSFFECHAGLTLTSVPVTVAGLYLGALAFGEITEKPKPYVLQRTSNLGLDVQTLQILYEEMPLFNRRQISMLAEYLYSISNCFIEIGVALTETEQFETKKNSFFFLNKYLSDEKIINDELINTPVSNGEISSPKMQKLVHDAEKFIINNYKHPITLTNVADFIHINPTYFSYLFRQVKGYTFKHYLTQLRIEKAKQLLLNSSLTVSEISQLIGYDDSNYFSRVFKKVTGFPPSLYRKQPKKVQI